MIDFLATVRAEHGLAEQFELRPALPGDLLWQALVRLSAGAADGACAETAEGSCAGAADGPAHGTAVVPGHGTADGLNPRVVGAYGHSRTDALVRGAGEAVERFALFPERGAPEGAVRGTFDGLGGRALPFHHPEVALGDPRAVHRTHLWYPARRLRDGAEVLVPAPLVDYPAATGAYDSRAAHESFDPTPSGAAAGQGYEHALRSALLEMIERDAFMVAWERGLRLRRLDLTALRADGPAAPRTGREPAARRHLRTLLRRTEAAGLTPVVADLPTGLTGVHCTVVTLLDDHRPSPLATVGCKVSDDPWQTMLGALQEALQLRTVVRQFATGAPDSDSGVPDPGAPVRGIPDPLITDDDRLRHVISPRGHAQIAEWVAGFTDGGAPPEEHHPVSTPELLRLLHADGADPLVVDLGFRLPPALREMGWSVVKVIPVGYHALRLSEAHDFTWHHGRLATAESRTGCEPGPAAARPRRPHPLP